MSVEKQLDDLKIKTVNDKNQKNDIKNTEEENVSPFLSTQPKTKSIESTITVPIDNEIFSGYSILYRFIPERKELKERGVGDLTIELVNEKNLYRIRMIRKQIESYACNHYVEPQACLTKHEVNKNTYIWTTTTDVCDPLTVENKEDEVIEVTDGQDWKKDAKKSTKQTFICRFKTEEISMKFEEMFGKARDHNEKVLFGKNGDNEENELENNNEGKDSKTTDVKQDSIGDKKDEKHTEDKKDTIEEKECAKVDKLKEENKPEE